MGDRAPCAGSGCSFGVFQVGEEGPVGFIEEQPEIPDGEYLPDPAACFHLDACEAFGSEPDVMMHITNNGNQWLLHELGVSSVDSTALSIQPGCIMGVTATITGTRTCGGGATGQRKTSRDQAGRLLMLDSRARRVSRTCDKGGGGVKNI